MNVAVCKVEVERTVHEVEGDEAGLITANQTSHQFSTSSSPELSPFSNPLAALTRWRGSPPSLRSAPNRCPPPINASSACLTPAAIIRYRDHATSTPSHKAAFDHTAIYPEQLLASSSLGPIRRHRSVTPSLVRCGESIRRPYSAAMTDQSAPGNRSYHPYAVSSHSGSAQSSPGTYNVPLNYNASITGSLQSYLSRSSSTSRQNSSDLPDEMNQMLHLDSMDTGYTGESATTVMMTITGGSFEGLYRSNPPVSCTIKT